jgi:ABC-type transport system involved in multi-copper enzyme maturation permease subunit
VARSFHISRLSPFGPIFEKELRVASRRKRNHLLRVLYLLGLFLLLMLAYLSMRLEGATSVAARMERQNQLGQAFFACFGMFCAIAMGLIGPVLTCTAISAERLHRTLHVLLMTPITSWQIVAGKLCSRLLIAFLLLGLSLPVLALVRLLGGVELQQMLAVMALCTAVAIFCGAIGLFFSSFLNRAYSVLLLSYASLLFLYMFIPFIVALLAVSAGPRSPVISFFTATNPFIAIGFITRLGRFGISNYWMTNVVLHLCGAGVLVLLSSIILRRLSRKEGEGRAEAPPVALEPAPAVVETLNYATTTSVSGRAPRPITAPRESRSVSDNPVLWREVRRPMIARKSMQMICAIVIVGLLLFTYMAMAGARTLGEWEAQIGFAIIFNGLLWLVISVISATAIAQEKESDTWTLLLATPLSARQIVLGKLAGLLRRLLWPFVLIVAHFFIFAVCGIISWSAVACVLWIMVTFNSVWLALGLYLSLRCKKVTFAVIVNLLVPIFFYAAVPLLLAILGALVDRGGDRYPSAMLYYLPYFYLGNVIEALRVDYWRDVWMPGWTNQQYPAETLISTMLTWSLIYIGIASFIVLWTINRFNRIVGRAEQSDLVSLAVPRLAVSTNRAT